MKRRTRTDFNVFRETNTIVKAVSKAVANRCAVIKFLTLEGCNPMNIHRRILTVYDGTCMSKLTVTRWVRMFSGVRQKTTEMLRPVRCTKL